VSVVELAIAAVFVAGGIRSLWVWSRRRFEGTDVVDHLLYALHLTGRIGLWFAFAGFFLIYATTSVDGTPTDRVDDFRWYLLVPLGLAAMQLVGGFVLGRRSRG
jgi:hypothetical protein